MDYPKFIVPNQKDESISMQRGNDQHCLFQGMRVVWRVKNIIKMTLERNLQPEVVHQRMASHVTTAIEVPKKKDELINSRNSPSNVHILMTSSSDFEFTNR